MGIFFHKQLAGLFAVVICTAPGVTAGSMVDGSLVLELVPVLAAIPEPEPEPVCEPEGVGEWDEGTLSISAIDYSRSHGGIPTLFDDRITVRFDTGPMIETRVEYDICVPQGGDYEFQLHAFADGHTNNGLHLYVDGEIQVAPAEHPLAGTEHIFLEKYRWNWHPQWLKKPEDIVDGPVVITLEQGPRVFAIHKRLIERPFMHQIRLIRIE